MVHRSVEGRERERERERIEQNRKNVHIGGKVRSLHQMFSDSEVIVVVQPDVHSPIYVVQDDLLQLTEARLGRTGRGFELVDECPLSFTHANVGQVLIPLHVS
jgi:hypothetical protein